MMDDFPSMMVDVKVTLSIVCIFWLDEFSNEFDEDIYWASIHRVMEEYLMAGTILPSSPHYYFSAVEDYDDI